MLLVLLYLILLILMVLPIGIAASNLLSLHLTKSIDIILIGLVAITVLSSLWVFFLPLGELWSIALIFSSLIAIVFNRNDLQKQWDEFKNKFIRNSFRNNLILLFIVLAVVYCSSLPAYMIDNESYYVQTIKWLDNYRLVKGIANLHVYLAQQSGFHILESALNFDSVYDRFNDLSAFYFLIGIAWSLETDYSDTYIVKYYRKGLMVLSLVCFTFISAPSPDNAVVILTYIMIYKFLKLWSNWDQNQFTVLTLLSVQLIYFKVTMALIFIFVVLLWLKNYKNKSEKNRYWIFIGLLFFCLFLGKNLITTGLPLFPIGNVLITDIAWELPSSVSDFFSDITTAQAYGVSSKFIVDMDAFDLFYSWVFHSGLEGFLNKCLLLSLLTCIGFLFSRKVDSSIKCVVIILLVHSIVLFSTSPQFRFFIPLLVPVLVLIALFIFKPNVKYANFLISTFTIIGLIIATFTGLQNKLTDNKLMKKDYNLHSFNLLIEPAPKSIYSKVFRKIKKNEWHYNSPVDNRFLYGTYDLPLPAVNKRYVEFMENNFQLSIHQLGDSISEGFKYKRVED